MTFHINIDKTKTKEFLQIVDALKSLGVIESIYSTKDLIKIGEPLDEETLLSILDNSKREIERGDFLTMEEVKTKIKNRDFKGLKK